MNLNVCNVLVCVLLDAKATQVAFVLFVKYCLAQLCGCLSVTVEGTSDSKSGVMSLV